MIHMPDAGGCFVELMNALHFSPSRPSLPNLFFPLTWYEMKHVKFYLLRDPRFLLFYSSWAVEGAQDLRNWTSAPGRRLSATQERNPSQVFLGDLRVQMSERDSGRGSLSSHACRAHCFKLMTAEPSSLAKWPKVPKASQGACSSSYYSLDLNSQEQGQR